MENNRKLTFVNPATGEQFGQLDMSTPEEVQEAVREMRSAYKTWRDMPVNERVRILRRFQSLLIDEADEITRTLNCDCGKSRQDALIEVFMTVDMLSAYLKHAEEWLAPRPVSSGLYFFKRCYVEPRPHGVVAIIAPWNYPFALSMPPVLAALLAGNTVVLKPSEVTAATGLMMERLLKRVPELSPFVRVVHGDGSVGAALVKAPPDYIFVTGSTPTGRKIAQAAAENLVPVACELGGKDAVIVLEDADLKAAAKWSVWGAFFNAGQTCMAVERVYVVEPAYDEFVRLCVEETNKLEMGYDNDRESPYYLGPITDPRQMDTIERHMADAMDRGAKVLTGGRRKGMFYEPTVLVNIDHDMDIMRDETFGPILPIMQVRDEADAIRQANDSNFGLGASIWSRDIRRAQRVARRVDASSVLINDAIAQFAIPMLPFGGIKHSGTGRTHGKEGLMQFTLPYAYAVGNPPMPFDLTVVARKPGMYRALSAIMHIMFGTSPQQKLRPVLQELERSSPQVKQRAAEAARKSAQTSAPVMAAAGVLGLAAGLAGLAIARRRK